MGQALRASDLVKPHNIDRDLEVTIGKLHVAASLLEQARKWNRNGQPHVASREISKAKKLLAQAGTDF